MQAPDQIEEDTGDEDSEEDSISESEESESSDSYEDEEEVQEDDTGAEEGGLNALPDYLSGPQDPSKMQLSREERQWALELKRAIQDEADLDELTDYMYAQFAIVDRGDLPKSMDRARNLQGFRENRDVRDTLKEAQTTLQRFTALLPAHLLHFFFNEHTDTWCFIVDFVKVDMGALSTPEARRTFLVGIYYLYHAVNHQFDAIRRCLFQILECGGFKWRGPRMIDLNLFKEGMEDVVGIYPVTFYKKRFCNAGTILTMFWTMIRRVTPADLRDKFEIIDNTDIRLDEVCLVPTVEAATARILRDLNEALRRRYENEATFRL